MNIIIKIALAAAITASSTAALHAETNEVRSISVRTSDLNLGTKAGQDALAKRIARASMAVCDTGTSGLDVSARRSINACVATTKANVLKDLASRGQVSVPVALAQ